MKNSRGAGSHNRGGHIMALSDFQHSDVVVGGNTGLRPASDGSGKSGDEMNRLRDLRLALSGALVGTAVVGLLAGNNDRILFDLAGALLGFVAVAAMTFTRQV